MNTLTHKFIHIHTHTHTHAGTHTHTHNYFFRYPHVYYNNFFSSVYLSLDLLRAGLYSCGTLRTNRIGYPNDMKGIGKKSKIGERGASVIRQSGNLTATAWQDNQVVIVLSTLSDPTQFTRVTRTQRNGQDKSTECPLAIWTTTGDRNVLTNQF